MSESGTVGTDLDPLVVRRGDPHLILGAQWPFLLHHQLLNLAQSKQPATVYFRVRHALDEVHTLELLLDHHGFIRELELSSKFDILWHIKVREVNWFWLNFFSLVYFD